MSSSNPTHPFFDLFDAPRAVLKVKFNVNTDETTTEILIENQLDKSNDRDGLTDLSRLCNDARLKDFADFYAQCNSFSLGTAVAPASADKKPLLRQLPLSELVKFTALYLPGGERAWVIDLNKSKTLYRGGQSWLAFAEVNGGPACLAIFLDGDHAGRVFLVCPQPRFNILKPVAKSYNDLLGRIAKDPAAFFRLTGAYVTLAGPDGQNYGYVPVEYV